MTISLPASMGISGEGTKTAMFLALTLAVGCLLSHQLLEPFPCTPNCLHAVLLAAPRVSPTAFPYLSAKGFL